MQKNFMENLMHAEIFSSTMAISYCLTKHLEIIWPNKQNLEE